MAGVAGIILLCFFGMESRAYGSEINEDIELRNNSNEQESFTKCSVVTLNIEN